MVTTQTGLRFPFRSTRGSQARIHLLVVFTASFAVYAACAPRTVAFEDDGSFIMAAYHWSIAHPPGFPLYVLLAKPFTWLPVGSIAFRVHLASGFFGATSCCLLWWIVRGFVSRTASAYAAAFGLAFSPVFWSQAIVAEVYTLNTLLFFALLAVALHGGREPSRVHVIALGGIFGASLSNHWPLMILSTPALALALWPGRRALRRHKRAAIAAFFLGLSPYLWMLLRSWSDPSVSFYGPIESLGSFASFVARRGYPSATGGVFGVDEALAISANAAREMLSQFTLAGALLVAIGAWSQWRRLGPALALGLCLTWVASSFALALILRLDTEILTRAVYRVFPMIPYGVMAIWLALGIETVADRVAVRSRRGADAMAGLLAAGLALAMFTLGLPSNDRHDYTYARDYAVGVLESLPPGASLFTRADSDTLPIGYLHQIEGVRPDVKLYHEKGLIFSNRLFPAGTTDARRRALLSAYASEHDDVFFVGAPPVNLAYVDLGFYRKVSGRRKSVADSFEVDPDLLSLFREIAVPRETSDLWTRWHRSFILGRFSEVMAESALRESDPKRAEAYRRELDGMDSELSVALSLLRADLKDRDVDRRELLARTLRAEGLVDERHVPHQRAELLALQGRIRVELGERILARAAFERAVEVTPVPSNPAVVPLLRLVLEQADVDAYRALRERIYADVPAPAEVQRLDRRLPD